MHIYIDCKFGLFHVGGAGNQHQYRQQIQGCFMIKAPWPLILRRPRVKVPTESGTSPKFNHRSLINISRNCH